MEIQQHDGVVVEVAGISAGLRQASARGRGVAGGEGGARGCGAAALPPPTIYRPPGGAPALGDQISKGGGGQGGRGVASTQGKWGAPTPRVSNPRRRGRPKGGRPSPLRAGSLPTSAHGALRDRWPHPVDPRDPSGGPGTIPITPKLVPMPETGLPIYKSLPPDHSGTPRDVRDLIRDSEQLSGFRILISLQP